MAWIESHTVLLRHRKLIELARELRLKPVYVLGHLHALWHVALEQQEDGDLSLWSDDLIAEMSCYEGDAPRFVSLLQTHGWLNNKLIHDWLDYAGKYLTAKYRTANPKKLRQILFKHKAVNSRTKVGRSPIGLGRSGQVGKNPKGGPGGNNGFGEFWGKFPRHTARRKAEEAWCKLNPDPVLRATVIEAIERQKQWPQWQKDWGQFIPHPATWLALFLTGHCIGGNALPSPVSFPENGCVALTRHMTRKQRRAPQTGAIALCGPLSFPGDRIRVCGWYILRPRMFDR